MPNLFQLGEFSLNSGAISRWKLECDALTDADWEALAYMAWQVVGPFGSVDGVPRGGLKLFEALKLYKWYNPETDRLVVGAMDGPIRLPHLIVDDVLTTGGSMERARQQVIKNLLSGTSGHEAMVRRAEDRVKGLVVFARGPCPSWIKPLFQMPEPLWIRKE